MRLFGVFVETLEDLPDAFADEKGKSNKCGTNDLHDEQAGTWIDVGVSWPRGDAQKYEEPDNNQGAISYFD